MELNYEDYAEWFRIRFSEESTEEELAKANELAKRLPGDGDISTSCSRYVWLPFRFEGDRGYLDWQDEWRLDDYE